MFWQQHQQPLVRVLCREKWYSHRFSSSNPLLETKQLQKRQLDDSPYFLPNLASTTGLLGDTRMETPRTLVEPLEGYRLWAETYDDDPNPLLALEHRILLGELVSLRGKRVLDVACGTGRWMATAQRQEATSFGIDRSNEMLCQAERKDQLAGRLVLADACRLPIADEALDLVICSFALGSMASVRVTIAELSRVTRDGGRVIISDLHPDTAKLSWRSTFRDGARVYEVAQHRYEVKECLEAGWEAGLQLARHLEPRFGEPERAIFQRAGRDRAFESARRVPAMSILIWKRR